MPVKFYIAPNKLPFDIIVGVKDLKAIGYQLALVSDENEAFVHERSAFAYDVDINSNTYSMMNYFDGIGNSLEDMQSKYLNNSQTEDTSDTSVDPDDGPIIWNENTSNNLPPIDTNTESIHNVTQSELKIDENSPNLDIVSKHAAIEPLSNNHDEDNIEQEYDLDDLLNFDDIPKSKITEKRKRIISDIIRDVCDRKGIKIAIRLKSILIQYNDRISTSKFDKGVIEGVEYEIPLKDGATPIYSNPYNTSPPQQKVIDDTVEVLLAAGIISEYDGPWGSPVVVVRNNDGSMRLCVDYSRRKEITKNNSYPCPNINDSLLEFKDKSVFSKFDITKAFHNIRVKEEHKARTAFVTKKGAYVWNFMPFGGKNCPATWARASDWVFRNVQDLIKYVDDIAIASKNDIEHLESIGTFFQTVTRYNLKLKLSKSEFFQDEIEFVGHMISANGIRANKKYVKQIIQLSKPSNKAEISSYCGFVGWLSKYCFDLKKALEPISKLKRKNVRFEWGLEQDIAHRMIQQIIDNADILAMPDWSKPFYLWVDASNKAYGGVLMQQKDDGNFATIEFMSKTWSESEERNWPTTTKELRALLEAVKKWEKYLSYNLDGGNLQNY